MQLSCFITKLTESQWVFLLLLVNGSNWKSVDIYERMWVIEVNWGLVEFSFNMCATMDMQFYSIEGDTDLSRPNYSIFA